MKNFLWLFRTASSRQQAYELQNSSDLDSQKSAPPKHSLPKCLLTGGGILFSDNLEI